MSWSWVVSEGLIQGDASYYDGDPSASDLNNAVEVAYLAADDDQRKKLVDMLWESGSLSGDKTYWYTNRSGEVGDLANSYSGYTPPVETSGDDVSGTDDDHLNEARFNGIPGNPELWKSDDGTSYLVYFAEGMEPPLPMMWKVENESELEAFFGPGKTITYDHQFTQAQIDSTGGMIWGTSTEIVDTEEDPLEGWASRWERERTVRPYLNDPEIYALYASAALEGRAVTTAELEASEWFQTHSEAERAWITTNASDPLTAQQMIEDNRVAAYDKLRKAGIAEPPTSMVDFMADQLTTGKWTSEMFDQQVKAVADPYSGIAVDAGVTNAIGKGTFDTTREEEDRVRATVRRWLGTNFGQWDDATVAEWAGKIRNEDDAAAVLEETLKDTTVRLTTTPAPRRGAT